MEPWVYGLLGTFDRSNRTTAGDASRRGFTPDDAGLGDAPSDVSGAFNAADRPSAPRNFFEPFSPRTSKCE
jgi:hypothetical protein